MRSERYWWIGFLGKAIRKCRNHPKNGVNVEEMEQNLSFQRFDPFFE